MATSPTSRTDRAEPRIDPAFDPEMEATLPSGEHGDLVRTAASRKGPVVWLVLLMVLAAGAVFFYLWRQNSSQQPAPAASAAQPQGAAAAAPAIRHPNEYSQ